jgi:uncharacterized protein YciI
MNHISLASFLMVFSSLTALQVAKHSFRSLSRSATTSLSSSSSQPGRIFVLEYVYVPKILELRGPHRPEHLRLLNDLREAGRLLGAGPWSPPTGALFLFRGESPDVAKQFAEADPYVKNQLVTSYTIREWTVVVGDLLSEK